jgi:hypothetical protein
VPGANDLVSLQDAINLRISDLNYIIHQQAFGVGYAKGTGIQDAEGELFRSPEKMFLLPADGEVGFVSQQAEIESVVKAIDYLVKQAAVTNGLPASTMSAEPNEESGISKIVGNTTLEELRRDDIAIFARAEGELFDLFRTVWNVHNPHSQMSDSATLMVDFFDPKPSVSRKEQLEEWEGLLSLGLASPVDILIELNPDLSRDDAKLRLLEIKDEINEFRGAIFV